MTDHDLTQAQHATVARLGNHHPNKPLPELGFLDLQLLQDLPRLRARIEELEQRVILLEAQQTQWWTPAQCAEKMNVTTATVRNKRIEGIYVYRENGSRTEYDARMLGRHYMPKVKLVGYTGCKAFEWREIAEELGGLVPPHANAAGAWFTGEQLSKLTGKRDSD